MVVDVIFIPRHERNSHRNTLNEIALAIYGTPEKIIFSEEFIPPGGRVPGDKVRNFSNYLVTGPNLLWAVKFHDKVVGFILIGDKPYHNAIGFSIDKNYAYQGIASAAFNLIRNNPYIQLPLNGYTSTRNISAKRFLEKNDFKLIASNINFKGEMSDHYRFEG
jgi:RimJ/RimL family protein N-acetyltransferase